MGKSTAPGSADWPLPMPTLPPPLQATSSVAAAMASRPLRTEISFTFASRARAAGPCILSCLRGSHVAVTQLPHCAPNHIFATQNRMLSADSDVCRLRHYRGYCSARRLQHTEKAAVVPRHEGQVS